MTKSEKICESLGNLFFFKEMVKSNLIYITDTKEEKELADIILRVGNFIIPIQIKEKDNEEYDLTKWLNNKVYKKAKQQIKISCKEIKERINFKDSTNDDILEDIDSCTIIPIIIFDINKRINDYQKIYISKENNLAIHIFSIIDFELMCHKLIAPMEMIRYLQERIEYINYQILTCDNIIAKNTSENSMLEFYIYKYDLKIEENINKLLKFNIYLSDFEAHCINDKTNYKIFIKKMSSFMVRKIYCFIDRIDHIINKGTHQELSWSNYILDDEQCILFISLPKEKFDKDFINFVSNVFMHFFKISNVLTIIESNIDDDRYELDFATIDYDYGNDAVLEEAINEGFADDWKSPITKEV